jgi:glycerol-3-phosphate acyltransferase PlsY
LSLSTDAILAAALGYTLGSIPFGLMLSLAAGKGDIRQIGSGSIGATNVLRTGSKWLAAATVLLDLAKGLIAVSMAAKFLPGMEGLAALAAVAGHCFPVWLGFKGGKGIATGAGVLFGLGWPIALASFAVWIAMAVATRISSAGGISAAIAAPIAGWLFGYTAAVPWLVAIAALVVWQHRANIARLRNGTEPKVSFRK